MLKFEKKIRHQHVKKAKLSTRRITHLCWCNWRTFWRQNAARSSLRFTCNWTTVRRLTGHLQHRINWPTWASSTLITYPILRIVRREIIAAAETCLDGHPSDFFWVACKSYSNWLRSVLSLNSTLSKFRVMSLYLISFLKKLSAPPCNYKCVSWLPSSWVFYGSYVYVSAFPALVAGFPQHLRTWSVPCFCDSWVLHVIKEICASRLGDSKGKADY